MLEQTANDKMCPFMSKPLYQTPTPGITGYAMIHEVYCISSRCMSWEPTLGKEQLEGYCKLLEEKQ